MEEPDIRLDYLRWVVVGLFKVDAALAQRAFDRLADMVESETGHCTLRGDNRVDLDKLGLEVSYRKGFLPVIAAPFEERYGFIRFWNSFKKLTMQYFIAHREEIKRIQADLPLVDFTMKASHFASGGNVTLTNAWADISSLPWTSAILTVRTQGITVVMDGENYDIGIDSLIAVGREVYHRESPKDATQAIRTIDYIASGPMSSLVVMGPAETVADFVRHAVVMQKEHKGLTAVEREILTLLSEMKTVEFAISTSSHGYDAAMAALKRLKSLKYIDEFNIITSDGLRSIHASI